MNRRQEPRDITDPEPGWFRLRLTRGGPFVGARIFARLGMLAAEVNGLPADVLDVWTSGERIAAWEFHRLDASRPATPTEPVDFRQMDFSW